ncbi:hypothetical protein M9458_013457, partial [Cirrhinus mrigala]
AILRALYAVLTHDISSRICDVALNIIECLLQLGVVPSMTKKASKPEDKEAELWVELKGRRLEAQEQHLMEVVEEMEEEVVERVVEEAEMI